MNAVVFLLVLTMSTSWILCFSSNNDGNGQEIFMVTDDKTIMHDAGIGTSKANPVQIGKFMLEDGKVLTLSRKSSPSRNCLLQPGGACGILTAWCCEGLHCVDGTCQLETYCLAAGASCALLSEPCCYPYHCSGTTRGSNCIPW